MRIAVLADTHGRLPDRAIPHLQTADEIWHLGDYCDLETLTRVRMLGRPFFGVLGNNDWGLDLPERLELERLGRTFSLLHIPPRRTRGEEFLLHGHTHVPRDEKLDGTRLLNPGSIGKANKGAPASWAWLDLGADGTVTWDIVRV
jgi:hypothetical protein